MDDDEQQLPRAMVHAGVDGANVVRTLVHTVILASVASLGVEVPEVPPPHPVVKRLEHHAHVGDVHLHPDKEAAVSAATTPPPFIPIHKRPHWRHYESEDEPALLMHAIATSQRNTALLTLLSRNAAAAQARADNSSLT